MAKKKSKTESPVLAVFNAMPDPALLMDISGTILHVTPPFEKFLELKQKDIIGGNILKAGFFPKEAQQILKKRLKKLEEESTVSALAPQEIYFPSPDGTERYVELTAISLDYEGAKADMVVLHDITERKRLEELAKSTEEVAPALDEETSDIIVMLDKNTTITYCSPSVSSILGYDPEELTGKNALEMVHPDDATQISDFSNKEVKSIDYGKSVQFRLLHRDGSWHYFELAGKNVLDDPSIEGIVLRFRDISGWKQAQAELKETKNKFQAIFENANDAIVYFDMSGVVIDINAKVKEILGYEREDVMGKKFAEIGLIPLENLGNVIAFFERAISGDLEQHSEIELIKKDGTPVFVGVSTGAIEYEGKPEGLFVIVHDITSRKEAERKVERLNAILRSIRNVNQLIVREKDRNSLIQHACDTLIETHGYNTAWIIIPNEFGEVIASAESGIGEIFPPFIKEINHGRWPQCAQLALAQPVVVSTNDPPPAGWHAGFRPCGHNCGSPRRNRPTRKHDYALVKQISYPPSVLRASRATCSTNRSHHQKAFPH